MAPVLLPGTLGVVEFVNADLIARGLSAFQPERVALEAGRIMLRRLRQLAKERVSFAFETTLAGRSFAPWLANLGQQGYFVHLVYLWLASPQMAVARVLERVRLGGHDVPRETVERRYSAGLRNFFNVYRPLADLWRFYDNSSSSEGPRLLAMGKGSSEETIADVATWHRLVKGLDDD